jgi:DNA-binding NarL/FixJ family response regulator
MSNKEIAARLSCAEVTVEKQLTQLFRSSGVRSRTELMARLHAL